MCFIKWLPSSFSHYLLSGYCSCSLKQTLESYVTVYTRRYKSKGNRTPYIFSVLCNTIVSNLLFFDPGSFPVLRLDLLQLHFFLSLLPKKRKASASVIQKILSIGVSSWYPILLWVCYLYCCWWGFWDQQEK